MLQNTASVTGEDCGNVELFNYSYHFQYISDLESLLRIAGIESKFQKTYFVILAPVC